MLSVVYVLLLLLFQFQSMLTVMITTSFPIKRRPHPSRPDHQPALKSNGPFPSRIHPSLFFFSPVPSLARSKTRHHAPCRMRRATRRVYEITWLHTCYPTFSASRSDPYPSTRSHLDALYASARNLSGILPSNSVLT
ncbi:hypothetical protein BKA58DRAFT_160086 [Alternaria rosae]|uniref:uncharacterized protein n=1 Tax=Alternaria rosae TaxID=1187941 RepID=UPI001E8DAC2C|nr:uncharacterized protein BKA58DRAFT_160086 [Alternaria rosae]KAH6873068.1 hypothetical protein BKA58DRAFT_160086 [Alternaria rosae]